MSSNNPTIDPNAPLLSEAECRQHLNKLPDWELITVDGIIRLQCQYKLPDFVSALALTNQLGELAESVDHHPAIELNWGRLRVCWWTHSVGGLTTNDFYMAEQSDSLFHQLNIGS